MSVAVLCCALGAFVFGMAHNITMALIGRFLMGIGQRVRLREHYC